MVWMWKELYDYRELLSAFTVRNIKIKYKQTFLGVMWAIFMPMIIVLSGMLVKVGMSVISGKDLELSQMASVTVKALPWAFFIAALKFSVASLVSNMSILQKIYFPRVIFPLSYILGQLFDFIIAACAFTFVLIFIKIGVSVHLLWLPVILLFIIMYTAGLGMVLSCANLFFRDVKYIIDVILTFAIFFTPVFYDADLFGKWETVLLLNPIAAMLEAINDVVVYHLAPDPIWFLYSAFWAVFAFFGGWFIFHKIEPSFAEYV